MKLSSQSILLSMAAILASSSHMNQVVAQVFGSCETGCSSDSDCMDGLLCAAAHEDALLKYGLDPLKADCQIRSSSDPVCFPKGLIVKSGGGFGDPHFATYDGTKYSFHGQCDVVLAQSSTFDSGRGLHVHARTQSVPSGVWSLISNAAIQIGSDTFELVNDGTFYYNGIQVDTIPTAMGNGRYPMKYLDEDMSDSGTKRIFIMIALGQHEKIRLSLYRQIISVHVDALTVETEGMLGHYQHKGMIGRDGSTVVTNPNEMGSQWQVTDVEPQLFQTIQVPQYPQTCTYGNPTAQNRRLQFSSEIQEQANQACNQVVDEDMRQFCIEDVLLTGDVHVAATYEDDSNNGFVF